MSGWQYIGVDWDSGAWLAVGITENGEFEVEVFDRMETLWEDVGARARRVVVDIPIGVCGTADNPAGCETEGDGTCFRECDHLARGLIGPRYRSVFAPPCEAVIKKAVNREENYALIDGIYPAMNERNRDHTGKGLTQQALSIAPGIAEVNDLVREKADPNRVIEGHPEVCFRAFGDRELDHSKRTAPGMAERLCRLQSTDEYEEGAWQELARDLGGRGDNAGIDDLVDALALAVTAAAPDDDLHLLPSSSPSEAALPMQIAYRREDPFAPELVAR